MFLMPTPTPIPTSTPTQNVEPEFEMHLGQAQEKVDTYSKICSYCNKSCQNNAQRVIHERIHTGEKPFKERLKILFSF